MVCGKCGEAMAFVNGHSQCPRCFHVQPNAANSDRRAGQPPPPTAAPPTAPDVARVVEEAAAKWEPLAVELEKVLARAGDLGGELVSLARRARALIAGKG